jgi:hypothetical protein
MIRVQLFADETVMMDESWFDSLHDARDRARYLVSNDFQLTAGIENSAFGELVARVFKDDDCVFEIFGE